MAPPLLEVIQLRKSYGPHEALVGVSFTVQEGEIFGLLGPNGAGKTTLMSIVATLRSGSSGEVRLAGRRLVRSDHNLRRLIGIVPQELALYGELTARENLRFIGQLYGLSGPILEKQVEGILDLIGLQDRADQRASTFSGGMQRRLNLGLALVHQPRLLLLDEPTTGVDPQSRHHLFEGVRRLNARGITIVYTSHYMEEVQALCQRVGIIDHGRLIACDTLPGLLRQLTGVIRFRVGSRLPGFRERLRQLPNTRLTERDGQPLQLETADSKATLLQVLALSNELGVEISNLEIEEPNLERVFLHLTGRALRD